MSPPERVTFFHFHAAIRLAAIGCAVLAAFGRVAAEKPAEWRNVIYNASRDRPALDGAAAKLFSDKYQVIAVKPGRDFVRARVKGHDIYLPDSTDPRPMREMKTAAKASVGFVVTADGLVKDLRVLESTDKRVADFLISQIQMRRFAPATYHGASVPSLEHMEAHFGPADERDNSRMFKDGLGIMGQRDR
jgi:hypothetical protein